MSRAAQVHVLEVGAEARALAGIGPSLGLVASDQLEQGLRREQGPTQRRVLDRRPAELDRVSGRSREQATVGDALGERDVKAPACVTDQVMLGLGLDPRGLVGAQGGGPVGFTATREREQGGQT